VPSTHVYSRNNATVPPAFFKPIHLKSTQCLSDTERTQLKRDIEANKKRILQKNPNAFKTKGSAPLFNLPIRAKAGFNDYGYYTLNFQVDQDPTPNGNLLDYNCGARSYDWATGNHAGTDYILWPYPWRRMQEEVMEIVAAAPGIIVDKRDGFFDLNCNNNGNPNWNGIVLEHGDGSQTWYLHFKDGSITSKNIGDSVTIGEYLGAAGSSGSSSIPHLHFEVYDAADNLIDPYAGPCNSLNTDSWWASQPDYHVPTINRIRTLNSQNFDDACPTVENTYEALNFDPGDELVVRVFYRDIQLNSQTHFTITDPNDEVMFDWTFDSPWDFATAWAHWVYNVDNTWPEGVYNITAEFGGNSYETIFGVGTNLGIETIENTNFTFYPNPSNGLLYIESESFMQKVEVFDLSGRKMTELSPNSTLATINLETAATGLYLVTVFFEGGSRSFKIAKE